MKNFISILFFALTLYVFSQTPQGFNYSAVARDATGKPLANRNVSVQLSILKTSATGALQFAENHLVNTDGYGLFNLVVGNGTAQSGSMNNIQWGSDNHYLKVAIDANGGSNYITMGTTQIMSVPYALNAKKADNGIDRVSANGDTLVLANGQNFINSNWPQNSWNLNGNISTNPTTNFIGTSDAQDLVFKTNNTEKIRIKANGNIGIGTTSPIGKIHVNNDVSGADSSVVITTDGKLGIGTSSPTRKLDVNGNVKIVDGTQGNGKILTSDANGNASWQTLSTGGVMFTNMQVYTNAGSFTFTVPAGVSKIMVEVWGGGGGGSCSNNYAGGGGAYGKGVYTVTPSTNYAVTVGAGGAGGVTGANGGNSSFGALISANGGSGSGGFGLGGTSTAPFNISGGDCYSTNSIYGINGGNGANGGQGGRTSINSTDNSGNGRNGVAPGGGGGNCGGGTTGGSGAQGRVVVYY